MAEEIGARELANVAYGAACGCKGHEWGMLFAALATATEKLLAEFKPQELANTAWAITSTGQMSARLFAAWATVA